MKKKENIVISGLIQLRIEKDGETIDQIAFKNLVVGDGKFLVAKLLGGAANVGAITKVGVGTNGNAASDSDNALANPVYANLTGIAYPAANQVQFQFNIPQSSIGSITIKEMGLLTNNNLLFARKVTPDYVLPAGTNLIGTWTITINN